MTPDRRETLTLPKTPEQAWEALDVETAKRVASQLAYREASQRCRALVVHMLRQNWARRRDLVGRPFTGRALTTIQQQEGLTTRQKHDQTPTVAQD